MRKYLTRFHSDQRGNISVMIPGLVIMLILVIGLVVDGSGKVQTHENARQTAAAAARAATNALSGNTVTTGNLNLDPQEAIAIANEYLAAAGMTGEAYVTGDTITVTTHDEYQTKFVNIIGISTIDVTASAAARTITEE